MRQAKAALTLVSCEGQEGEGEDCARAPAPDAHCADSARHVLLKEWMGSHTRILGLWLDRLLEEGDDGELISMIHRQYAWLSMMQARMERG